MISSPDIPVPIRIEDPRTPDQANIAACAVTLLGAPFQLHGRSAQTGLDCVGVAACCLCAVGEPFDAPTNYSIRGDFEELAQAFFDGGSFEKVRDSSLVAGDLLLLRPGHRQIHFAVLTLEGAVHAHMGLARVVLTPLPLPYPEIGRWRFKGD